MGLAAPAHASSRAVAALLASPDAEEHRLSEGRHEGAGSRVQHWTAVAEKRPLDADLASSWPSALQNVSSLDLVSLAFEPRCTVPDVNTRTGRLNAARPAVVTMHL